ncbi:MAG: thiamine-phosphate kinase [Bacteroidetes bacterium HGW-Bacteroidetes-6]|jgi:thiamine-monophosphate kinase|nr:MAG: thiamine-phosphate kinase [Bacteroidetes bacterium HGW-Bacteroidetes-6]
MLDDKNPPRTEISSLGEFGLIRHLTQYFPLVNKSSLKGVGDDAAVVQYAKDEQTLISTDLLLEGVHFDLTWMPLQHLGYKAVAVNLSDIAAMNGIPQQILVSIGVSSRFPLEALEELYAGMKLACDKYKVDLIGGDTSSSVVGLVISITVLGKAKASDIVYRNGAKPNDLICVSGDLGGAYAGLLVLQREKKTFEANPNFQPDLQGLEYAIERQLKPEPRLDIIETLRKAGIKPSSMIDVSDGLSSELHHICTQSGTGCSIYEDKIPFDFETSKIAEEFNISSMTMALHGGEDYELLFTVPLEDYEKIKDNNDILVIGHITDKNEGLNLISKVGQSISLKAQGWDSFKNNE